MSFALNRAPRRGFHRRIEPRPNSEASDASNAPTALPPPVAPEEPSGNHRAMRGRGMALWESLIVLLLAVLLGTAASVNLLDFLALKRLQAASGEWSRVLASARHWAFAQQTNARLELHNEPSSSCLVLHTGPRGACRGCGSEVSCAPGAQLLASTQPLPPGVQPSGTSSSLAWSARERTVTPTGTLRLATADGRSIHHVVNLVGRVRLCSPDGLVWGMAPC